jgi:ferredoxin
MRLSMRPTKVADAEATQSEKSDQASSQIPLRSVDRVVEFGDKHFGLRIRLLRDTESNEFVARSTCPVSIDPRVTITHEERAESEEKVLDTLVNWFYDAVPKKLEEMEREKKEAARKADGGEDKEITVPVHEKDPSDVKNGAVWFNSTDKQLRAFLGGKVIDVKHPTALKVTKKVRGDGDDGGEKEDATEKAEETSEEAPPNPYPPMSEDLYRGHLGGEDYSVYSLDYGQKVSVGPFSNLRRTALKNDLPMYKGITQKTHCRGLGLCGTCEVLVSSESMVNEPTVMERLRGIKDKYGRRLGCQVQIEIRKP